MNCKKYSGVEVFRVKAMDQGGYYGVLLVNWDSKNEASLMLDLVLSGISPASYYNCKVTDMWFPSIFYVANGLYEVAKIPPHGNVALMISCKKPGQ